MSDDSPFENSRMRGAMDALMKSEEGREIAENLKSKLKQLNDQFKDLNHGEKQKFLNEFRDKFSESIGSLKDTLGEKYGETFEEEVPNAYTQQLLNYLPFMIGVTILLLIFGFFGYKLYKSIMEKETKREKKTRKQLKDEKKTQSPPSSPRSKKEQ
ncbi:CLUMA_CG021304, isoform A [Clunio marinus]|uniref:CLUMA_CG021304, isoform A n=1 Tax=Clunio marinus TaxID=568069 RepID=A0A1J1J8J9_9DIPT|nr:CLUMA_CG021304, isoform A [Clunio marinus]